jgi:transcription antitermination factor NusG
MGLKGRQLACNRKKRKSMNFERSEQTLRVEAAGHADWCALRVRPRWEKLVAEALAGKGYEQLLPLYRKRSQWSDRVKVVEVPLFAGYVFCRADFSSPVSLVTTPGVLGILRFGGAVARISEDEIAGMRAITASGLPAGPWPYLGKGQHVRIDSGVLRGFEGVLVQIRNEFRLVLTVEALGRSVAVEVDRAHITPLPVLAA